MDSWRRTLDGKRIYTPLTTIDDALKRCREASKQDISKNEFINHLKVNDIFLFNNLDEHLLMHKKNETTHLHGFDYVGWLHRHSMIGRLSADPTIYGLLVPVDTALLEINDWSAQEINRGEVLSYLKRNDVHVFNSIDDFVKSKEKLEKDGKFIPRKQKRRRQITDQTKEILRKRMHDLNEKRRNKEAAISL